MYTTHKSNAGIESSRGSTAVILDSRTPRVQLLGLPSGPAAVEKTLVIMARLARDASKDSRQYARFKAIEIFQAAGVPSRGFTQEVRALQQWVQSHIAYMRDPVDFELVQSPEVTLKLGRGDCDDQAVLLGSMLVATGHPSRFVAMGINHGPLSHVLVQTKIGETWTAAETILKKPLGWFPPDATSRLIRSI